jgi:cyclase
MSPKEDADGTVPRVIVSLTMLDGRLVRTRRFAGPSYVGDPINAVRIFSEKGADELMLLDIGGNEFDARTAPRLADIASEALMPIAYGGGIRTIEHVRAIIRAGFEKVVLNTALHAEPSLATRAADEFGTQAVVASIDVGRGILGGRRVRYRCGRARTAVRPVDHAIECERLGCGEILLTSIDRDGCGGGYDEQLLAEVTAAVTVPVIARGGASSREHFRAALAAGASAVAAGNLFVYWGPRRAVLVNYPDELRC